MDQLLLARLQFATTSVYHFLFVPLTLGLVIVVAVLQTQYVRSGDEKYKALTKFWGKLFLINFAMGVVTGLVQEFQFGMNWSGYSRYVGDIFGVPLAIEALAAFFVESTFIGIWIFGWDKLPKKLHLACIWLVALASNLSAFWILVANSFMQNPVGYTINNGRAEMTSFAELLTNPYVWHQFPHVVLAGLCTAAFFVMGISAYHLIRQHKTDLFKTSFKYGAVIGVAAVLLVILAGHTQGQFLTQLQPMKMAAAEAHWETSDPADLAVVAFIDEENRTNTWELSVPKLLSFMNYNRFSGEIQGLNDMQAEMEVRHGPGNYIPPVTVSFWSFRIMVGTGMLMLFLVLTGLFLQYRGILTKYPLYLKVMVLALFLPYIANFFGWILTEMGRQPWVVYGLQTVYQGVSTVVSANAILTTLIGFVVIYTALIMADIYLLAKYARQVPEDIEPYIEMPGEKEGTLWI